MFFSGRISRCPYCNSADHLGRDCPHKGQPRCFSCNVLGHVRANCPDLAAQSTATNVALAVVEDPESAQISPPPLSTAETPTAEPAAAASQDLFEDNSPPMDSANTASNDPPSDSSAVEISEEEEPTERPRSRSPINRAEQRKKNGQQPKKKKDKKHK